MPRTDDSYLAKAGEQAQAQIPGQLAFDPVEMALPEPLVAIPVRNETPAQGVGSCTVLSAANPVLPLLPRDPRRRHALVLAVDNDVYLASSLELAQGLAGAATGVSGFYLPKGIVVPVVNKAAWWAAATTTGSSSRISVMVDKDDE